MRLPPRLRAGSDAYPGLRQSRYGFQRAFICTAFIIISMDAPIRLLVNQIRLIAAVWLKIAPPINSDHFQRDSVAVHLYQDVMISALSRFIRRFGDAVESDLLGLAGFDVIARVGVAGVRVKRRAASASNDVIEPVFARLVFVTLHPMLERVVVAGKDYPDVMLAEHRHVPLPQDGCLRFHLRAAVWA